MARQVSLKQSPSYAYLPWAAPLQVVGQNPKIRTAQQISVWGSAGQASPLKAINRKSARTGKNFGTQGIEFSKIWYGSLAQVAKKSEGKCAQCCWGFRGCPKLRNVCLLWGCVFSLLLKSSHGKCNLLVSKGWSAGIFSICFSFQGLKGC